MNEHIKEDDQCLYMDCTGLYEYRDVENCSCHINPPCGACVENPLVCNQCGEYPDE